MTDLEMTKLCAEAMGLQGARFSAADAINDDRAIEIYDPLHNDAQTMALVKRFGIVIGRRLVWVETGLADYSVLRGPDVNRNIVECVAKMQKAKKI